METMTDENYILEEDGEYKACYSQGTKGQTFDSLQEAVDFMEGTGEDYEVFQ